jgi:hypothetical protein
MSLRDFLLEQCWVVAIAGSMAWGISVGKATLWHLLLPMGTEYIVYLVSLPLLQIYYRNQHLKRETVGCLRLLAILVVLVLGYCGFQAWKDQQHFGIVFTTHVALAWNWVEGTHTQWASLLAGFHALKNMIKRIQFLVMHGPPFIGAGMGCGMRVAVLVLAGVILPVVAMFALGLLRDLGIKWKPEVSWFSLVWVLWGLLLLADILAIWFRWDIQGRLTRSGDLR